MMVYHSVSAVGEFNQAGTHRASLVFLVAMSIPEHGDLLYPQKVNFQLITLKVSWVIYPCETHFTLFVWKNSASQCGLWFVGGWMAGQHSIKISSFFILLLEVLPVFSLSNLESWFWLAPGLNKKEGSARDGSIRKLWKTCLQNVLASNCCRLHIFWWSKDEQLNSFLNDTL